MKIKIVEYESKYCNDVSNVVIRNLLEINSKDYGLKKMEEHSLMFTPEKIEEYSKNAKIFVAINENQVLGTLRAKKDQYNGPDDYVFLTIFVLPEFHRQGIGRLLVKAGEKYVSSLNGEMITIPASIYAHKFYNKLGYEYINGTKPNKNDCILMRKMFNTKNI